MKITWPKIQAIFVLILFIGFFLVFQIVQAVEFVQDNAEQAFGFVFSSDEMEFGSGDPLATNNSDLSNITNIWVAFFDIKAQECSHTFKLQINVSDPATYYSDSVTPAGVAQVGYTNFTFSTPIDLSAKTITSIGIQIGDTGTFTGSTCGNNFTTGTNNQFVKGSLTDTLTTTGTGLTLYPSARNDNYDLAFTTENFPGIIDVDPLSILIRDQLLGSQFPSSTTGTTTSGFSATQLQGFCDGLFDDGSTDTGLVAGFTQGIARGLCKALSFLIVPNSESVVGIVTDLYDTASSTKPFNYATGVLNIWRNYEFDTEQLPPDTLGEARFSSGNGSTTAANLMNFQGLETALGEDNVSFIRAVLGYSVWALFAVYVFNKSIKII